jgi:parvulin-like peptidyl-prolyl isomerase
MKIRTVLHGSAVALLAMSCLAAAVGAQQEPTPEESTASGRLVARVNGEEISLYELSRAVNQYVRANRLGPDSGMTIPQIQDTVLDRMIATRLVEQRGRDLDLMATIDEIDARMADLRAQAGTPEDFRLMLTVQSMTEPELRRLTSQQITAEKVIEAEVFAKMTFTEEEIRRYYEEHRDDFSRDEQVHARHIFIQLRPDMTEEERADARSRIDAIRARLAKGEPFEELAVTLSEDAAAANGGDLGWLHREQVAGPFEVVAFSTPVGEISDVVATDYGYHIIEVLERKEGGTMTLEGARPLIEEQLRDAKTPEAVRGFIDGLRAQAEIEILLHQENGQS